MKQRRRKKIFELKYSRKPIRLGVTKYLFGTKTRTLYEAPILRGDIGKLGGEERGQFDTKIFVNNIKEFIRTWSKNLKFEKDLITGFQSACWLMVYTDILKFLGTKIQIAQLIKLSDFFGILPRQARSTRHKKEYGKVMGWKEYVTEQSAFKKKLKLDVNLKPKSASPMMLFLKDVSPAIGNITYGSGEFEIDSSYINSPEVTRFFPGGVLNSVETIGLRTGRLFGSFQTSAILDHDIRVFGASGNRGLSEFKAKIIHEPISLPHFRGRNTLNLLELHRRGFRMRLFRNDLSKLERKSIQKRYPTKISLRKRESIPVSGKTPPRDFFLKPNELKSLAITGIKHSFDKFYESKRQIRGLAQSLDANLTKKTLELFLNQFKGSRKIIDISFLIRSGIKIGKDLNIINEKAVNNMKKKFGG